MLAPLANAPALAKALANSNSAWKNYVPSPLTVCYTDTALTTAARVFRVPVTPSADALTYDVLHELLTGTGTTAITITIEIQIGGRRLVHDLRPDSNRCRSVVMGANLDADHDQRHDRRRTPHHL
jgi:hypothetical protein